MTPNLDTHKNQLWFSLKLSSARHVGLRDAWNQHGEKAFSFEALEQLKDTETEFPDVRLKTLKVEWSEKLGAETI